MGIHILSLNYFSSCLLSKTSYWYRLILAGRKVLCEKRYTLYGFHTYDDSLSTLAKLERHLVMPVISLFRIQKNERRDSL